MKYRMEYPLTNMTMTSHYDEESGEIDRWEIYCRGVVFLVRKGDRGDWETTIEGRKAVIDVSGDFSGSMEYIGSLYY